MTKSFNEIEAIKEVINHFKINLKRQHVFSRCMVCNCDQFYVASKLQMIKLKYENCPVPDELERFLKKPEKFTLIEFPEQKRLWKWQNYAGEKKTKSGTAIHAAMVNDGTMREFQTFYICFNCAKIYWDGGHYLNHCGGKFDHVFNLFPEADNA